MRHRAPMRAIITILISSAVVAGLAACGGSGNQPAAPGESGTGATAQLSPPPPATAPTPIPTRVSVQLVWSHIGKFFDETQVWYVARVTNSSDSLASVSLDALALDAEGVIVGSSTDALPDIRAHSSFDYFGYLGGGAMSNTELTGTPKKIQVSQTLVPDEPAAFELPMLKTDEIRLSASRDETYTNAPFSYSVSAKVTNTTDRSLMEGALTQQVVLYDNSGRVVGGDTGSSDNAPERFPADMSYREQWTGIPAVTKAARAVFTVWATSRLE